LNIADKFTRKGQAVVAKPLKRQQPRTTRKGQAVVAKPLKRQ
jgi:hypothetical protein